MPTGRNHRVTCYRCRVSENVQPVNGLWPDYPPGWAVLSLSGTPAVNRVLCPTHVRQVRAFLMGVTTLSAEQLTFDDVPTF